ncbi:TA system toxin CbtA family protein [Morganella morganii]|uniref:TA system toxin CbtA family protein n=1 Tax=Morganella morganii TaxID=582 RepID=UPI0006623047|nr:TA system toxin CbtA family protein [Morganella morganii]EKU4001995.1 toxin [Morganella morganii]ELN8407658.1 toxin [Morganella morganii]MBT0407176.1 toxin [Morganella morganii subsp. morganii]MBT0477775.1 toxin [Morganella morganii subsp. morganii]MCW3201387.1 toxin [Morganella morganii]
MNNTAVPASPAAVWQTLLTYLLQQHYGLTLNDTEFSDERVLEACLCRGMSLCEALNAFAEKYALVRTDRRNNSITEASHSITATDILRARKATGLITLRRNYTTRRHCNV